VFESKSGYCDDGFIDGFISGIPVAIGKDTLKIRAAFFESKRPEARL